MLMFSLQSLDNKIHETVETINSLKTSREFFLSFAKVEQVSVELIFVSPCTSGPTTLHQQVAAIADERH